jgi:hypothetical protein
MRDEETGEEAMEADLYEIAVRGTVGRDAVTALRGFAVVSSEHGETRFVGWVCDQAALHGALDEVFALGLELRSVHHVEGPGTIGPSDGGRD